MNYKSSVVYHGIFCCSSVCLSLSFSLRISLFYFTVFYGLCLRGEFCLQLNDSRAYSVSQKNPPYGFLKFFSKTVGNF